jgi:hypothetical protein
MTASKLQLQRRLQALACLTLLLTASPFSARAEPNGAAPASQAEPPAAATRAESSEVASSELQKEIRSGGSRLFQFHPIWQASQNLKEKLHDYGLTYALEMSLHDQYASKVTTGQQNYASYSWRFAASWRFLRSKQRGSLFVDATLLGSPRLNYDPAVTLINRNIGSISELNGNLYPDPAALDELLIKYVAPSTRYGGAVGKLDLSNRFDTNRVANDAFRQFTAFSLENNLAIPWPEYGGVGAFIHADIGEQHYVMAAAGASVVAQPFGFGDQIGDGNLYQLVEIGTEVELPGIGVGHYRLTPWHARVLGRSGWGVGFNFDQELFHPDLVAFFRFGLGEPSITPVRTFVSGGVSWLQPWGRAHDVVGVGVAWSNPSTGRGFRNETLIEVFYRFSILPWVQLSPDLQIVYHPAQDDQQDTVLIPGIRLYLSF